MPIRAVVYTSEAAADIAASRLGQTGGKLCEIVDDAARFNRNAGVTGVLLFDGARFVQYMEGPDDGLLVAYSRVLGASSHCGVIELQRGRVGQRRLPFWPMRWLPVEPTELRRMAGADWTGFVQREGAGASATATGMDLLRALVEPYAAAL
ncbi:BLUF domain-containing protein [Stenotrophomonas indicatrix]|uniref:BLUF domain-containing protein n=1 Tax=Stenotrophomonas indicatrix TaxID=2045451 RepID=UPI00215A5021|nr:BLUF domain-containing protein [Stenotrophomonas indicatrix]MCR8713420.1 BLUF domain-containing protein [Stenotrophomonas indicatrix]